MPRGSSLILLPAFSSAGDGFSHLLFSSPSSVLFSSPQLYPVVASSWKRRDPPRGAMGGRRGLVGGYMQAVATLPLFPPPTPAISHKTLPPPATIARCKEGGGPSSWQACGSSLGYGEGGRGDTTSSHLRPQIQESCGTFCSGGDRKEKKLFLSYTPVCVAKYLPTA